MNIQVSNEACKKQPAISHSFTFNKEKSNAFNVLRHTTNVLWILLQGVIDIRPEVMPPGW